MNAPELAAEYVEARRVLLDALAARKIRGLEAALVDNSEMAVTALEPSDPRSAVVKVAGVSALLIAKAHKLGDRLNGRGDRLDDKDASDVVRLMTTALPATVGATISRLLKDPIAAETTREGKEILLDLFGKRNGRGIAMAAEALRFAMPADRVQGICLSFTAVLADGRA